MRTFTCSHVQKLTCPPVCLSACLYVQNLRRRKEEIVVRGAVERAAKEVEGCTFRPQTTECPAYITVRVR